MKIIQNSNEKRKFPDDFVNKIICGDCLEVMKDIPNKGIDLVIADPPYGLEFMGKEWDKFKQGKNIAGGTTGIDTPFGRSKALPAFYQLDKEGKITLHDFSFRWASECLRVLKPGGYLLSFAGTRTYHRIASGIEDAGFEVRDMIAWVYGSGFPKSLNIGKAMDGVLGKQASGFNTAGGKDNFDSQNKSFRSDYGYKYEPKTDNAKQWEGWGTALKPAFEPIVIARKPLEKGLTVAENVLKWGVGGLNIDECRVGIEQISVHNAPVGTFAGGEPNRKSDTSSYRNHKGRFPANFIHDGSEEVLELFPKSISRQNNISDNRQNKGNSIFIDGVHNPENSYSDSGSVARFFYCAKASPRERNMGNIQNTHPTVKPIKLIEYLIKLITKENYIVLDPFLGSGTTAIACVNLGRHFIGIEKEPDYVEIANRRLNFDMLDFEEGEE